MANLLQDFYEERRQGNPLLPAEDMRQLMRNAYDTSPDLAPLRIAQGNLEKLLQEYDRRKNFTDPDQILQRVKKRHQYIQEYGAYPGEGTAPYPAQFEEWMRMFGGEEGFKQLFPFFPNSNRR